jgi:hypothetical protein
VLVTGETGTGKELVAQAVHAQSGRADKPMISINCAALPDNLVESELFGHVRGAFTGALSERSGKFEQAHQGTLFLDEVGELSLPVQAKLLRVLQSGQLQRLGSDREHHVDVRVIAATNRDLAAEVRAGRMRADFYHRLNVYPLNVPPLRERDSDVLQLAGYFLEENRSRLRLGGLRLDAAAQAALLNRSWPGNVRELEHCISRAVLRALSRHDGSASRAGARLRIVTLGLADLWERAEAPAAEQAAASMDPATARLRPRPACAPPSAPMNASWSAPAWPATRAAGPPQRASCSSIVPICSAWPSGWRSTGLDQRPWMPSSSTSKFSVALGGTARPAPRAAVGNGWRAGELGLAADLHLLHALGPAGDHAIERELDGLLACIGAVELLAGIGEVAAVVHLDGVRRLGTGPAAFDLAFIDQPAGGGDRRSMNHCASTQPIQTDHGDCFFISDALNEQNPTLVRSRVEKCHGSNAAGRISDPGNADIVQRLGQMRHGAIRVMPFVQAEQADAEGLEVRAFIALQRHARGGLQAHLEEGAAALDFRVGGVADDHARRLVALGRHAGKAARLQQLAHLAPSSICSSRTLAKPYSRVSSITSRRRSSASVGMVV